MSLRALIWAFDQEVLQSTKKFVLVSLANFASESGKSFPSVPTICRLTSLNDKTVRKALAELVTEGIIVETGAKVGFTGQIKVYQLPEETKEPSREKSTRSGNSKATDPGGLCLSEDPCKTPARPPQDPRKTPVLGGDNYERRTENEERTKRAGPPTLLEMENYGAEIGLPKGEVENCRDHYVANGWKVGKNPMRDWHAVMRNWQRNFKAGTYQVNGNGKPKQQGFTLLRPGVF